METQETTISGRKHGCIRMWLYVLGIVLVYLLYCKGCTGQEWTSARIGRMTGVNIPEFKITNTFEGKRAFNGDYEDQIDIEFESVLSDELFKEIDKMIAAGNTKWFTHDGKTYSFSMIWGVGDPAPPGEREGEERFFRFAITKGMKTGEIRYGAW